MSHPVPCLLLLQLLIRTSALRATLTPPCLISSDAVVALTPCAAAIAPTDVLQGVVLFFGSIIFLIIQRTELGGLARAYSYWSNPGNAARASVRAMQFVPAKMNIVSYFDFVFKTTVAATMFPHLTARLFAAQNAKVIQRGMACMVFTFFVVQFSSMVTGWVAIDTLRSLPRGASAFGELLKVGMLIATTAYGLDSDRVKGVVLVRNHHRSVLRSVLC